MSVCITCRKQDSIRTPYIICAICSGTGKPERPTDNQISDYLCLREELTHRKGQEKESKRLALEAAVRELLEKATPNARMTFAGDGYVQEVPIVFMDNLRKAYKELSE